MIRAIVVLTCLIPFPSYAHTQWANGDPVPDWIRTECCGVSDAHRIDPSDLTQDGKGYRVPGYADSIPFNQALPSQDGYVWVFFRTYPDGSQSHVYCLFIPMAF